MVGRKGIWVNSNKSKFSKGKEVYDCSCAWDTWDIENDFTNGRFIAEFSNYIDVEIFGTSKNGILLLPFEPEIFIKIFFSI